MIAGTEQTFAVVLIIAAAAGYLGVALRRAWRLRGGGCCGDSCARRDPIEPPVTPTTQTRFVPSEQLSDLARQRARDRTIPPGGPAPS